MDDRFPASATATLRRGRRGFTLVEMLVVIAIIGVLASLIMAVGGAAIRQAKRTTIKMDISQLETAMHAYKEKYGDYPPDFAEIAMPQSKQLVLSHLRKAFPRYIPGQPSGNNSPDPWVRLCADVSVQYPGFDLNKLSPAEAIVFWLGGMPGADGQMAGFSADPANPFRAGGSRLDPLFEFDQTRLFDTDDGDNWLAYKSEHVKDDVPYVYFRPRVCQDDGSLEYGCETDGWLLSWNAGNAGICVPYCIDNPEPASSGGVDPPPNWNKPKSFQIISPGMDGRFGNVGITVFRESRDALGFDDGDYDNITNFSSTTLEDGLE